MTERGGHDDPVQPGAHPRVAAEAGAVAMCREERILGGVRGVLWIMEEAPGDRVRVRELLRTERNNQIVHNGHHDRKTFKYQKNVH